MALRTSLAMISKGGTCHVLSISSCILNCVYSVIIVLVLLPVFIC